MKLKYYLRGLAVGILLTTIALTVANMGNRPLTDAQIRQRARELGMVDGDSIKLSALQSEEKPKGDTSVSGRQEPGAETVKASEPAGNDSQSVETKPQESEAAGKVPESKPQASKPAESKAQESKPQASKPAESKAQESKPQASKPAESKPQASKPAESKVPESKPQASKPAESKVQESKPQASKVPESKPQASKTPESKPQESKPAETPVTIRISGGTGSYAVSKILAEAGLVEDAMKFDKFLCDNGYSKTIRTGTYEIYPGTSEEDIAKMISR